MGRIPRRSNKSIIGRRYGTWSDFCGTENICEGMLWALVFFYTTP